MGQAKADHKGAGGDAWILIQANDRADCGGSHCRAREQGGEGFATARADGRKEYAKDLLSDPSILPLNRPSCSPEQASLKLLTSRERIKRENPPESDKKTQQTDQGTRDGNSHLQGRSVREIWLQHLRMPGGNCWGIHLRASHICQAQCQLHLCL